VPPPVNRAVDILFVIDDSGSMRNEQENLQAQFVTLINELENVQGGLPDVHIGVVSTDLGTGGHTSIRYCETLGGDQGILGQVKGVDRAETCIGPGQRYVVDVAPTECIIDRTDDMTCRSHTCTQADCDRVAAENEVLQLVTDAQGCPRCRNYDDTLSEVFSCLAEMGTAGCGFEQPLEAMHLALNENETPENSGFLRYDAYLAAVIITDEDDCSAAQPDVIFDPDPALNNLDSELGYLHSFRCFEFGVTCAVDDRQATGPRADCAPREDEAALLYQISRYTAFMESIKDPAQTVVAAIAGPVEEHVTVIRNAQQQPEVKQTCSDDTGYGAKPGVRLRAFVAHFNEADALSGWAYTSVCESNFSPALEGIGNKIAEAMKVQCPGYPYAGCRNGPAGTACSPCLPQCELYDVEGRGTENEQKMTIPWCGRVCENGLCRAADMEPCTDDENGKCTCAAGLSPTLFEGETHCAPLLYTEPPDRDYDERLPSLIERRQPTCSGPDCYGVTSACWYLSKNSECDFGAVLRIVRGAEPPPRTFPAGVCQMLYPTEQNCTDGIDGDQDCLSDTEDPDCEP
jgi:hypothetical protein